jgi:hypothetical protein
MNILASLVGSKRLSLFLSGMGLVVALHAASGWSWAQAPDTAAPLEASEQAAVEADSGLDADAAQETSRRLLRAVMPRGPRVSVSAKPAPCD